MHAIIKFVKYVGGSTKRSTNVVVVMGKGTEKNSGKLKPRLKLS